MHTMSDSVIHGQLDSRIRTAPPSGATVRVRPKARRPHPLRVKWARSSTVTILAATGLAIAASILGWVISLKIARLFNIAITENLPSVGKAQELQIALLEQRGFVASYMLDEGNEAWLNELDQRKRALSGWLTQTRATTRTAVELEILSRLNEIYEQYDNKRDEAIALYRQGQTATARRILLEDVYGLYLQTNRLCEDFVAYNQNHIRSATVDAHREVSRATWTLGLSAALICGLGIALLSLSFRRLLAEQRNRQHKSRLLAAQAIQEGLLPHGLPTLPAFDIGCIWYPAEFTAGDYIDYLPLADGSARGDCFGEERLLATVRANCRRPAQEVADGIYRAVRDHVRNEELVDDLTATVIRVGSGVRS